MAAGDGEALRIIEGRSVVGVQDDYQFWSANGCDPSAGKPVWVVDGVSEDDDGQTKSQPPRHHILFNDNIHNDPTDSIVSVRRSKGGLSGTFRTLTGAEIVELQGCHLFRVPTIEPIMDELWFLRQIVSAETRLRSERLKPSG